MLKRGAVISAQDVESIYEIPLNLNKEGLDDIVIEKLGLQAESADLSSWSRVVDGLKKRIYYKSCDGRKVCKSYGGI